MCIHVSTARALVINGTTLVARGASAVHLSTRARSRNPTKDTSRPELPNCTASSVRMH